MKTTTRNIDLRVPTGWNQCSTPQLELIISLYLHGLASQDRYHPFDPLQWKVKVFLALTGLEIVGTAASPSKQPPAASSEQTTAAPPSPQSPLPQETTYLVRLSRKDKPFPLRDWELLSFVEQHLKWLDDFNGLLVFPYPRYGRRYLDVKWLSDYFPLPWLRRCEGPSELMQDFSWSDYRMVQQWMDYYVPLANRLASVKPRTVPDAALVSAVADARAHVLAALFRTSRPLRRFRRMPDPQFQLCLIFWQSMMAYYARKFHRCFKSGPQKGGSRSQQTPLDLYTRSTATLQKYLQQSEAEINRQPFYVILQHLDDIAREAEEMERINRRGKSRH